MATTALAEVRPDRTSQVSTGNASLGTRRDELAPSTYKLEARLVPSRPIPDSQQCRCIPCSSRMYPIPVHPMETTVTKTAWIFAASLALSLPASGWAQGVSADGRAVSGTVIPGSGTTDGARAVAPENKSATPAPVAGSLSGLTSVGRCAALRKRYAQSQSCFQHFRLKNGGLRPGAAKQCKQIENPSVKCGSEIVG